MLKKESRIIRSYSTRLFKESISDMVDRFFEELILARSLKKEGYEKFKNFRIRNIKKKRISKEGNQN